MAKSLLALALGLIGGGTCNRGPLVRCYIASCNEWLERVE
jgi:hypothetical protein